MPFSDLTALVRANNVDGLYAAIEAEHWRQKNEFTPTTVEAQEFLTVFTELVAQEAKGVYGKEAGLREARLAALAATRDWLTAHHAACFVVACNPCRVAFQLALRIRRPRIINQGAAGFCGPQTILSSVAKRDPVKYARLVLDLAGAGQATWEGQQLQVLAGDGGFTALVPDADFIPMLALRRRAELIFTGAASGGLDLDLADVPSHATTPSQLTEMLIRAGYHGVEDRTTNRTLFPVARTPFQRTLLDRHLRHCATLLTGHNRE